MKSLPLHVLAAVDENPAALSSMILPLAAEGRAPRVTLYHAGDRKPLEDAERVFRQRGLPTSTVSGEGPVAREIGALAKASRCDLIAMLTHGRRGLRRALWGSVAEDTLRSSSRPMLLGRAGSSAGPWRIVVAALDGGARAERILSFAGRLAKVAGTPLHLLRAYGPGGAQEAREYLSWTCGRLLRRGILALPVARRGSSARAIVNYARDVGAGVLCMVTHGRAGLKRVLAGSVTEEVVRRAPCPVLTLRV